MDFDSAGIPIVWGSADLMEQLRIFCAAMQEGPDPGPQFLTYRYSHVALH